MNTKRTSIRAGVFLASIIILAPVFSYADTAAEIQARINKLLAQLEQLQAQLRVAQTPPVINSFSGPATTTVGVLGTWIIDAASTTSFRIDWKDGVPGGEQGVSGKRTTVTHKYNQAGTYTILLTARNAAGVATTTARVVVVNKPAKPTPTISSFIGPATLYVGDRGTWTIDATNTKTYFIDWKDGVSGGDQGGGSAGGAGQGGGQDFPGKRTAVTHKYNQAGTFTILLTARGPGGSATATTSVIVNPKPTPAAPVINSFSGPATTTVGVLGTWIIDAASTTSFRIDWKDGVPGGEQGVSGKRTTVTHKYNQAGTFTVLLTARGPGGSVSTSTQVTVEGKPAPVINSFTGPATLKRNERGIWTVDVTNVTRYQIDWKDGEKGGTESFGVKRTTVEHRYSKGGIYTILLTATGAGGSVSTTTTIVVSTSTTASLQLASAFEGVLQTILRLFGQ